MARGGYPKYCFSCWLPNPEDRLTREPLKRPSNPLSLCLAQLQVSYWAAREAGKKAEVISSRRRETSYPAGDVMPANGIRRRFLRFGDRLWRAELGNRPGLEEAKLGGWGEERGRPLGRNVG